jgi:hypothetical protein
MTVEIEQVHPDVESFTKYGMAEGWPAPVLVDSGYVQAQRLAAGIWVEEDAYYGYRLRDGDDGWGWYPTREPGMSGDYALLHLDTGGLPASDLDGKFIEKFWEVFEYKFGSIDEMMEDIECTPRGIAGVPWSEESESPAGTAENIVKGIAANAIMCTAGGVTWFTDGTGENIGTADSLYIEGSTIYKGRSPARSQRAQLPTMSESLVVGFGAHAVKGIKWNWKCAPSAL